MKEDAAAHNETSQQFPGESVLKHVCFNVGFLYHVNSCARLLVLID